MRVFKILSRASLSFSLIAGVLVFVGAPNSQASSTVFSFTGTSQSWTVPAGITSISVTIVGAGGGNSSGGLGRSLSTTLYVSPGSTIQINVGGRGSSPNYSTVTPGGSMAGLPVRDMREEEAAHRTLGLAPTDLPIV